MKNNDSTDDFQDRYTFQSYNISPKFQYTSGNEDGFRTTNGGIYLNDNDIISPFANGDISSSNNYVITPGYNHDTSNNNNGSYLIKDRDQADL